MNWVLLKPTNNKSSQVILNENRWENLSAVDSWDHRKGELFQPPAFASGNGWTQPIRLQCLKVREVFQINLRDRILPIVDGYGWRCCYIPGGRITGPGRCVPGLFTERSSCSVRKNWGFDKRHHHSQVQRGYPPFETGKQLMGALQEYR